MDSSLFAAVALAPRDPILGLTEAFNADTREMRVNLGVGVYCNDEGKIPLLRAVREAERARVEAAPARGYQPIDGPAPFARAVRELVFGADSVPLREERIVTVQSLGGTGALKLAADFTRRLLPPADAWISDPSWENHRALLEAAGFRVSAYRYYDPSSHGVDFAGMRSALAALPAGSVVVLHACCHNPTGADLGEGEWREVAQIVRSRGLVAILDLAYQGFADGIVPDAAAVRIFAEAGLRFFVASSFSKSFSLYGERVGALSIVTSSREEAARVLSQVKRVVRTNYSSPPTHGGAIVTAVLSDARLRALWEEELGEMRSRIREMREGLVRRLAALGVAQDFSFIARQRGMFSYTGLTAQQVERLRDEFGIYAVASGRICLAALNSRNLDYVADAIAALLKS
ncbi:MAG: aspartate/tyrosine/aromatic aminotransferase [Rhodocyclaceae bacterium]